MTATLLTDTTGRLIDLAAPTPADIDFAAMAEQLAKENRFNGATPGSAYSVAQHLVLGAGAVYIETGDPIAAAYFVLHDGPEAYLKDDTTPKKRALELVAVQNFGVLAGSINQAFAELTHRFDVAIHCAAHLPFPPPPAIAAIVHRFDKAMLLTEWRDLMPRVPCPSAKAGDPPMLPDRIWPWSWTRAARELSATFARFLPVFGAGGHRRDVLFDG